MDHPSSAAVSDDDDQFVAQLTSHQGVLLAYLNTLLPGNPEVSDIVQKTNLVLWNKRADFQHGSSFRAWAFSIAYWEARAWMTTSNRKAWLLFDTDLAQGVLDRFIAESDTDTDSSSDSMDALRLCLSKLRESDRLIIVNHYQHEKSLADCSRVLGRSREALKAALFRSRAALKRCIKSQLALQRANS